MKSRVCPRCGALCDTNVSQRTARQFVAGTIYRDTQVHIGNERADEITRDTRLMILFIESRVPRFRAAINRTASLCAAGSRHEFLAAEDSRENDRPHQRGREVTQGASYSTFRARDFARCKWDRSRNRISRR